MTEFVLWSGGKDSTVLVYHLAKNYVVQPLYIKMHTGAERNQIKAMRSIFELLHDRFPNVLEPKIIDNWRWQFSRFQRTKGNRNLRFCELLAKLGCKKIWIGEYATSDHVPIEDCHWQLLQSALDDEIEVWSFERLYPGMTEEEAFEMGMNEISEEVMHMTWSCQLWWNEPCGQCFSCIERSKMFEKFSRR